MVFSAEGCDGGRRVASRGEPFMRAHHTQKLDHYTATTTSSDPFSAVVVVVVEKDSISGSQCVQECFYISSDSPTLYLTRFTRLRWAHTHTHTRVLAYILIYVYTHTEGEISHSLLPQNNIAAAVALVPREWKMWLISFSLCAVSAIYNLQYIRIKLVSSHNTTLGVDTGDIGFYTRNVVKNHFVDREDICTVIYARDARESRVCAPCVRVTYVLHLQSSVLYTLQTARRLTLANRLESPYTYYAYTFWFAFRIFECTARINKIIILLW